MIKVNINTPSQISASINPTNQAVISEDHDTTYTLTKVTYSSDIIGELATGFDIVLTSSDGDIQRVNIPIFTGTPWGAAGTIGLVPPPNEDEGIQFLRSDGTWDYIYNSTVHLHNVTNDRQVKALDDITDQGQTRENHLVAFSGADGATIKDSEISIADIEAVIDRQDIFDKTAVWADNRYTISLDEADGEYEYRNSEIIAVTFSQTNTIDNPVLYIGDSGRSIYQNGEKLKANQIVPNVKYLLIYMPPIKSTSNTGYWMVMNSTTMTGATGTVNGTAGYVPAPNTSDKDKFLRGDGEWADIKESIKYPQQLDNNQDLNSVDDEGYYWIPRNNTAINTPRDSVVGYGQSFSLTITKSSTSSIVQVLTYTGTTDPQETQWHETYQRRKLGNTGWTPWVKMLTDHDIVVCSESEYNNMSERTAMLYFIREEV